MNMIIELRQRLDIEEDHTIILLIIIICITSNSIAYGSLHSIAPIVHFIII